MRVRTSDGLDLAVAVVEAQVEDAPTVLCVHGYPDNKSLWEPVARLLSKRYRVVSYDVRGAGDSDTPSARSGYELDQLAADLLAVADAVSPEEPVHVLAHDWGSIQAWHAVTEPAVSDQDGRARFASYTSISGPNLDHVGHWMRKSWRTRAGLRQAASSGYIGFFHLPMIPELMWRTGAGVRVMSALEGRSKSGVAPERSDALHGLDLYRANIRGHLGRPQRRTTEVPVQVLVPQGDPFVSAPLQSAAEPWTSRLWMRRYAGGHWLPRAEPETVATATSELIEYISHGTPNPRLDRASVHERTGRFAGKLVVITGFGNGIGQATATAFAKEGADVVGCDLNAEWAEETASRVRAHGGNSAAYQVDVSDAEAMEHFAKQVRDEFGIPDIVVNNAGIAISGAFTDTSFADWAKVLDVNLWGVIHGARLFTDQMIERGLGGQIVNIASAAAYTPSRMLPAYATTKSAVLMLSECMRAELAGKRIGVTAVCPGLVNSNITNTTRFVGVDAEEQQRRQQGATQAYARRNYSPDRTAQAILRAVVENKPVAPVTPEAHFALATSRFAPALMRLAAKFNVSM